MTADGHVIALVLPVVGDGPLNIVVDGSPGVFSVLEPGMSVWLDQGRPTRPYATGFSDRLLE